MKTITRLRSFTEVDDKGGMPFNPVAGVGEIGEGLDTIVTCHDCKNNVKIGEAASLKRDGTPKGEPYDRSKEISIYICEPCWDKTYRYGEWKL